jgi:hypothetical protein
MHLTAEQSFRKKAPEAGWGGAALKTPTEHTLLFQLGLGGFGACLEV